MTVETTLFFIKPEAVNRADDIREAIEAAGLTVKRIVPFVMDAECINGLYGHLNQTIKNRLISQLLYRECVLGIVEGENAITRLVEITGERYEPALCNPHSIRFRFGDHTAGLEHHNAIHRPKTPEEVEHNFKVFGIRKE